MIIRTNKTLSHFFLLTTLALTPMSLRADLSPKNQVNCTHCTAARCGRDLKILLDCVAWCDLEDYKGCWKAGLSSKAIKKLPKNLQRVLKGTLKQAQKTHFNDKQSWSKVNETRSRLVKELQTRQQEQKKQLVATMAGMRGLS